MSEGGGPAPAPAPPGTREPYLSGGRSLPYCPGCGHPHVLRALDQALGRLDPAPGRVVLVTDIGCVGLADPLFPALHTVHTLHGRSVAVAAGLTLGVRDAGQAPLLPLVLIGDGGVGIGLLHVVHAAQMNVDVKVLVHNNLVYGMTGGQHSVLTPPGLKTATTPGGCPIPPLDLHAVLGGAGAGFFARAVAPGDGLVDVLAAAISHPGFACVELYELCPTFATARGGVTGRQLARLPQELGLDTGILRRSAGRPVLRGPTRGPEGSPPPALEALLTNSTAVDPGLGSLTGEVRLVVAGRAGERVQSAAELAAAAACASGLQAALRTDNPVTQGTGFSLAELAVGPEPIAYTGLEEPDLLIAVAPEGLAELRSRGLLDAGARVKRSVLDAELAPPEGIRCEQRPFRARFGGRKAALGALMEEVARAGWWPRRAWELAIASRPEERRAESLALLDRLVP